MMQWLLLLLLGASALEAADRSGTSAAVFLKLAGDARSSGLAGATVALPAAWQPGWGGAGNLLVNPAVLAGALRPSVAFSNERRMAELTHGLFHASRPFSERLTLALAGSWIDAPEQEITTLEEPEGTGLYYGYGDLAIALTAGYRLTDRLAVGASIKYIRQDLHNETAQGVGVDLGLLLETGWRDLRVGMAAANFGSRLRLEGEDLLVVTEDGRPAYLESQEFQLPLNFRVGLSDRIWRAKSQELRGMIQATHSNDNRESAGLGVEYIQGGQLFLRAGRHLGRDLERWSLGLGLHVRLPGTSSALRLDYAHTTQERFSGLHQFSLSFFP